MSDEELLTFIVMYEILLTVMTTSALSILLPRHKKPKTPIIKLYEEDDE